MVWLAAVSKQPLHRELHKKGEKKVKTRYRLKHVHRTIKGHTIPCYHNVNICREKKAHK